MSILSPQVEKLIQETVAQGGFASPDDVVRAGIALLQQNPLHGDFVPGEMDELLEEGERSGPSLDGEQVLAELREQFVKGPGETRDDETSHSTPGACRPS